ncbi:unnamed protein product [Adineta steineri]|uniref:ARID domain-containing protein n=1 Tax=Adineta steineri TaxID=433720 RepID=A0A814C3I5_9BILA|nr:unnamed protein product [Adineta steineri]CAF1362412.1 unnamed protein product [Adineta steineri]
MHGGREKRSSSILSQSISTDETNTNTSTTIESASLPVGCLVSGKYRGSFCSAQVKAVDKQVKLKVQLLNTNDIITISEEQVIQPAILRIGNIITIRLPISNRPHETTSYLSRSGLAAIMNANNNYEEKQVIIKKIYDNSIYTVVFDDGDEVSLRRSLLCLRGIRLYQTQIGQQKFVEDIPISTLSTNSNDTTSIVAIRRSGNNNSQHAFPALILKRKSLPDYMWVKSFLDGREYIVHKRDDVHSYKNNSDIQSLCNLTSEQATKACEKFIKKNQIPVIWQKKKKKSIYNERNNESDTSGNDSNASDTDFDDNNEEETTEEKDSFVAQLYTFMDDSGTPINNIAKIHNYDLDLHRLFKIVRLYGGYNKVTKNDQWGKVYMKMGLPDEPSPKNNRLIENAYKKYLSGFEDLSKKLGTMNVPSAYFGSRNSLSSDSRRSLVRLRQQSDDKNKSKQVLPFNKRQSSKTQSVESKPTLSSTKNGRKAIIINKTRSSNINSLSTSESEVSDNETTISSSSSSSNTNRLKKQQIINSKKKSSVNPDEKKKIFKNKTLQQKHESSIKRLKSTGHTENDMKPIIKIPKISYEILKESTLATRQFHTKATSKVQHNPIINQSDKDTSDEEQSKAHIPSCESTEQPVLHRLTSLAVTPVSPSPPPSITDESPTLSSISTNIRHSNNSDDNTSVLETSSTSQTLIPLLSTTSQQTNTIENLPLNSNKRSYSCGNIKKNEQLSSSKRSRHSIPSLDSYETNSKQVITPNTSINNGNAQLTYEDISINDTLVIKRDFNRKKQYYVRCIEKNDSKKELRVQYKELDSIDDEWIEFERIIKRQNELDSNTEEILNEENNQKIEENNIISTEQDNGIWKSLEMVSPIKSDGVSYTPTIQMNDLNNQVFHEEIIELQRTSSATSSNENIISINIGNDSESIDDNESNRIPRIIIQKHPSIIKIDLTESTHNNDIPSTSNNFLPPLYINEEIIDNSPNNQQSIFSPSELSLRSNSPIDNRRASVRQLKRRTFRESKDSSLLIKKRMRLDTDINSNSTIDNISNNNDQSSTPNEQQSPEIKRYRTVGKRGGKRTVIQPDNENEDIRSNSLINITLNQQLEDMFKNRTSRYNFLDLDTDKTGDDRLVHLKDRMRQCQKVFLNLKHALTKIEKQRRVFLRRQKSLIIQSTTNDLFLPSTCT